MFFLALTFDGDYESTTFGRVQRKLLVLVVDLFTFFTAKCEIWGNETIKHYCIVIGLSDVSLKRIIQFYLGRMLNLVGKEPDFGLDTRVFDLTWKLHFWVEGGRCHCWGFPLFPNMRWSQTGYFLFFFLFFATLSMIDRYNASMMNKLRQRNRGGRWLLIKKPLLLL